MMLPGFTNFTSVALEAGNRLMIDLGANVRANG